MLLCRYGLTGGVFTNTEAIAQQFLAGLNVGSAYWNLTGLNEAFMPWSGTNMALALSVLRYRFVDP